MYISKIYLHNFKGFKGDHEMKFDSGINFFVGDNNCGKSTVFQAIDFIQNSKSLDSVISKNCGSDDYVLVEIELRLKLEETEAIRNADNSNLKRYAEVIINDDKGEFIRIRRSNAGEADLKKVYVLTPAGDYQNKSGIDKNIALLFDTQIVWADTDPNDIADFGKTKICGKIINSVVNDFSNTDAWKDFVTSHKKAFGDEDLGLVAKLKPIEERLNSIMSEQYGNTEIKFNFSLPEIDSFFKNGSLNLSENGIETSRSDKGNGMQRALALSLIQLFADINNTDSADSRSILFLLDEPETYLHPKAQTRLLCALEKISNDSQIFIATHSPYLLRQYKSETHSLSVFSKGQHGYNDTPRFETELDLFGASSPTWGEINYVAFDLPSVEFHDELYGFIQEEAMRLDVNNYEVANFDNYLAGHGIEKNKNYNFLKKGGSSSPQTVTLPTLIRNEIHHPENTHNPKITEDELRQSIEELIKVRKFQNSERPQE